MRKYGDLIWEVYLAILPWFSIVIFLYYGLGDIQVSDTIAIVVAAVPVMGAFLIDMIKSFRNGKTIDEIQETATKDIAPKVQSIDKAAEANSLKLDSLVSDLVHRQRLESQFPKGMQGVDMMSAGATALLQQCEKINQQYQEAQNEISELKIKNSKLEQENRSIEMQNARLLRRIDYLENISRGRPSNTPNQELEDSMEPDF